LLEELLEKKNYSKDAPKLLFTGEYFTFYIGGICQIEEENSSERYAASICHKTLKGIVS
jgi:hypothetical protein